MDTAQAIELAQASRPEITVGVRVTVSRGNGETVDGMVIERYTSPVGDFQLPMATVDTDEGWTCYAPLERVRLAAVLDTPGVADAVAQITAERDKWIKEYDELMDRAVAGEAGLTSATGKALANYFALAFALDVLRGAVTPIGGFEWQHYTPTTNERKGA